MRKEYPDAVFGEWDKELPPELKNKRPPLPQRHRLLGLQLPPTDEELRAKGSERSLEDFRMIFELLNHYELTDVPDDMRFLYLVAFNAKHGHFDVIADVDGLSSSSCQYQH